MLTALFRLVELVKNGRRGETAGAANQPTVVPTGRILIDGVDIATVGLHTLRRRITIIPQVSPSWSTQHMLTVVQQNCPNHLTLRALAHPPLADIIS